MRAVRILSAALLTLGLAVAPAAADSSPSPEASGDSVATTGGNVVPHRDGGRTGADRHGAGLHG